MDNKTKNTIPLWAFIFTVAMMIALGIFSTYMSVQGFMNDVSFGRSNRVLPRAEYPYDFWINNVFAMIGGMTLLISAIWISKVRHKQFKLKSFANIKQ